MLKFPFVSNQRQCPSYKVLPDGRRQVGGFYLPGDIFGLEFADEHTLSAEAIDDSKVLVIKRSALNALTGCNASVAQQLFALTGRELHRVQDHLLLLIKTAQERVAGFLLEMADRASAGNIVELPMSRQDIADYLGLTIETVSRTLSSSTSTGTQHDRARCAGKTQHATRCCTCRARGGLMQVKASQSLMPGFSDVCF